MVLFFEIYMLPLTLLVIFMKNYIIIKLKSVNSSIDDEVKDHSRVIYNKKKKKTLKYTCLDFNSRSWVLIVC